MSVQIDREYYSPEIYRVQSSSLNSTTPHPVNGILFTQVTTKYFDSTISAALEFEFNRTVIEKKKLFSTNCVCVSHMGVIGWLQEKGRGKERCMI